jgi:3-hydroxyanthranilate 3,4-dioxygenase
MWFCESCGTKLYEEFLPLTDIVTQLPPIFERFWTNIEHRTCSKCGSVLEPPVKK